MSGPERVTRDQPGSVVAAQLGINPRTLQAKARDGLVPHDRQPPGYRNFLYNLEEVRRTFPVATVRRRAREIEDSRKGRKPEGRFTVKQVYRVTCTDCGKTETVTGAQAVARYKAAHEAAFHSGNEDGEQK